MFSWSKRLRSCLYTEQVYRWVFLLFYKYVKRYCYTLAYQRKASPHGSRAVRLSNLWDFLKTPRPGSADLPKLQESMRYLFLASQTALEMSWACCIIQKARLLPFCHLYQRFTPLSRCFQGIDCCANNGLTCFGGQVSWHSLRMQWRRWQGIWAPATVGWAWSRVTRPRHQASQPAAQPNSELTRLVWLLLRSATQLPFLKTHTYDT